MKTILLLLLTFTLSANSQTILSFSGGISGELIDGHNTRSYDIVTSATPLDHLAPGEQLSWNFNQLTTVGVASVHNSAPTAEETTVLPGITMVTAIESHDLAGSMTNLEKYYSANPGNTYQIHAAVDEMFLLQLIYSSNNFELGIFPKPFGSTITDAVGGMYTYDTFSGTFSGTATTSVDATGELTTNTFDPVPYPVTRMKIIQNLSFNYEDFGTVGTLTQVIYYYYRVDDFFPYFKSTTTTINVPLLGINETTTVLHHANPAFLNTPDMKRKSFSLYPNPAHNTVSVAGNDFELRSVKILDINGRFVMDQRSSGNSIDVSLLNRGMYILQIETDMGVFSEKLLKN